MRTRRDRSMLSAVVLLCGGLLIMCGCAPTEPNELDKLGTVDLRINGATVRAWVTDNDTERARGLMFVTEEEMADISDNLHRGMLFVFPWEQHLSFYMKNTIIPLDIAYMTSDGTVINTHTMTPLDDRFGQYRSDAPARFALELNAGMADQLELTPGTQVEIPESVLKDVR